MTAAPTSDRHPADPSTWSNDELAAFVQSLREPVPALDGPAMLARVRVLEQLKAAAAAAQATVTAAFVTSRRAAAQVEIATTPKPGVGTRRRLAEVERGIVADVAVARRESPAQASRFIAFAQAAPVELPQTFGLLASGALSERRARAMHHATAWLQPEHRRQVDHELAGALSTLGDRQIMTKAEAVGYRLDPEGACDRVAAAERERHVSMRPRPTSMVRLSALLPLVDGVACWAALDRAARSAKATGDERGRGQIMADTLVELLTGRRRADGVDLEVDLVMTDETLLGESDEPVRVLGHGVLPARYGRELVLADTPARRAIRRLFTDPAGTLAAMESTARLFTPAMRRFLRIRDDVCRTPWCDAPIQHADHVTGAAHGGPTSIVDGRGLCARCNYTAQAPGTVSRVDRDGSIVTRTPTGQHHRSRPPDPPRARPRSRPPYPIDLIWPSHAA